MYELAWFSAVAMALTDSLLMRTTADGIARVWWASAWAVDGQAQVLRFHGCVRRESRRVVARAPGGPAPSRDGAVSVEATMAL